MSQCHMGSRVSVPGLVCALAIVIVTHAGTCGRAYEQSRDSHVLPRDFSIAYSIDSSCVSLWSSGLYDYAGEIVRKIGMSDTALLPFGERWNADGTPRCRLMDSVVVTLLAWKVTTMATTTTRTIPSSEGGDSTNVTTTRVDTLQRIIFVVSYVNDSTGKREWVLYLDGVEAYCGDVVDTTRGLRFSRLSEREQLLAREDRDWRLNRKPSRQDILDWIRLLGIRRSDQTDDIRWTKNEFFSLVSCRYDYPPKFGREFYVSTCLYGELCNGGWLRVTGEPAPSIPGWTVH